MQRKTDRSLESLKKYRSRLMEVYSKVSIIIKVLKVLIWILLHLSDPFFFCSYILILFSSPCSSSVSSGRQHVNGADLFYEQTGGGKHAVLLLPGALGKRTGGSGFGSTPFLFVYLGMKPSFEAVCFPPQEAQRRILVLS